MNDSKQLQQLWIVFLVSLCDNVIASRYTLPFLPGLQSKHGLWKAVPFYTLTAWYLHSLPIVCSHFPLASVEVPAESCAICQGQPEDVDSTALPAGVFFAVVLMAAVSNFLNGVQVKRAINQVYCTSDGITLLGSIDFKNRKDFDHIAQPCIFKVLLHNLLKALFLLCGLQEQAVLYIRPMPTSQFPEASPRSRCEVGNLVYQTGIQLVEHLNADFSNQLEYMDILFRHGQDIMHCGFLALHFRKSGQ